jgi:uncharacterized membrane protein
MGLLDTSVIIFIALIYNIFVHYLASTAYKNYSYTDKVQNTNALLIVFGITGIVASKLVLKKDQKYSDSVVSRGLLFGGLLILLTVAMINWGDISDETRLLLTGSGFLLVLYLTNKYMDSKDEKQKE